jgi:hypothetical protein
MDTEVVRIDMTNPNAIQRIQQESQLKWDGGMRIAGSFMGNATTLILLFQPK